MTEPDLTVGEVAQLLDLTPQAVETWIAEGRFPGARQIKAGWRIPRPDVDALRPPIPHEDDVGLGLETPRHPSG